MIRIAICDDEQKILDQVTDYIHRYAEAKGDEPIEVVPFDAARKLVSALEDGRHFDVFVLDVYIGDEMGTTLAASIRKKGIESPIIFATTSLEHAPESFETGTLRYLIKPINEAKLCEAMDAALLQVKRMEERALKLKTENGIVVVNAGRILYSEAHDHYQYLHGDDGEEIKVRMTVAELYALLCQYGGFVRIGSAYVVNLRYVKNITRTDVLLYNNRSVQIPRGKYAEIKSAFWDYHYEGQED